MADLAIGISKSVVEKLVNKVKTAVKEEKEKWQTLHQDIVFIKDEFEMMQSFLNTTGGEHMKNLVARTWVRQLRDLSYATEDCIEFVFHLDTKPSIWQRLLQPSVVQTTLPLDEAVEEIKQLKAQAEDVNRRNMRYSLTGRPGEHLLTASDAGASHRTLLDMFIKPREAFDNQDSILDLRRLIETDDMGLRVIMVCGSGTAPGANLVTTSIIKKAYDEPDICKKFERHAWVKLTHPFVPHDFIRSLMTDFCANDVSPGKAHGDGAGVFVQVLAMMKTSQDTILKDFIKRIKEKPYLIVLEDLSSVSEWNAIRMLLPDMKNGSRVVVSTQQPEIAALCTRKPYHVWLLRGLSSTDHSIYAFVTQELPKEPQVSV